MQQVMLWARRCRRRSRSRRRPPTPEVLARQRLKQLRQMHAIATFEEDKKALAGQIEVVQATVTDLKPPVERLQMSEKAEAAAAERLSRNIAHLEKDSLTKAVSRHEEAKTHVEQMRLLVASGVQQPAASSLSPPPEFAPFLSLLDHIKGRANHTGAVPQVMPEDLIFLKSVIAKMGWTPASEFSSMPLPVLHPQQQQQSPTGQQQLLQHSGQVPCYSLLEDDEDLLQDAECEEQLGGLREQVLLRQLSMLPRAHRRHRSGGSRHRLE